MTRLTAEREAEVRRIDSGFNPRNPFATGVMDGMLRNILRDLLAELDAVRGERDEARERTELAFIAYHHEREALRDLLAYIADHDDDCWQMLRDQHCPDCTAGCVPDHLNRGPCPYHQARRALAERTEERDDD